MLAARSLISAGKKLGMKAGIVILSFSVLPIPYHTLAQADSAIVFYPLSVGDSWQYIRTVSSAIEPTSYLWMYAAYDTVMPNGKRYVRMEVDRPEDFLHSAYRRIDSTTANIYDYDEWSVQECLAESLRASAGDQIYNVECWADAWCRSYDTTTSLLQPTITKSFYVLVVPNDPVHVLAKGLGLVRMTYHKDMGTEFYYAVTLIYAEIGCKQFGQPVSVAHVADEVPRSFELAQNYPNPFNPSTTIKYELPQASHVTLKVYSTLGQEVATLVHGLEDPGYKSVEWNATGMSSGVYFYRLQAGDFVQTCKLLVLR